MAGFQMSTEVGGVGLLAALLAAVYARRTAEHAAFERKRNEQSLANEKERRARIA